MINQAFLRSFDLKYLDELIRLMGLHSSYPVQPMPLFDVLNVNVYRHMKLPPDCPAFSTLKSTRESGWSAFDKNLSGVALREAAFHELGHLLWHHDGRVHGSVTRGGVVSKEELEANIVGCYLAIPATAMMEFFKWNFTYELMAAMLNVTPTMLQLRAEMMVARDELGVRSHPIYAASW